MKRGQPLRRTPLARTGKKSANRADGYQQAPTAQRSRGLSRGNPIAPRSAKATARQAERVAMLRATDADQTLCQRCQQARAVDAHEVRSRARGGSPTDRDNIRLLCRTCHTWITEHPTLAEAEGWSK